MSSGCILELMKAEPRFLAENISPPSCRNSTSGRADVVEERWRWVRERPARSVLEQQVQPSLGLACEP